MTPMVPNSAGIRRRVHGGLDREGYQAAGDRPAHARSVAGVSHLVGGVVHHLIPHEGGHARASAGWVTSASSACCRPAPSKANCAIRTVTVPSALRWTAQAFVPNVLLVLHPGRVGAAERRARPDPDPVQRSDLFMWWGPFCGVLSPFLTR